MPLFKSAVARSCCHVTMSEFRHITTGCAIVSLCHCYCVFMYVVISLCPLFHPLKFFHLYAIPSVLFPFPFSHSHSYSTSCSHSHSLPFQGTSAPPSVTCPRWPCLLLKSWRWRAKGRLASLGPKAAPPLPLTRPALAVSGAVKERGVEEGVAQKKGGAEKRRGTEEGGA